MRAIDDYYHLSCLTYICNRQRSHKTKIEKEQNIQEKTVSSDVLAFAELLAHIEEASQNKLILPVFKLATLRDIYASRIAELDQTEIQNVHSTRLKQKLMDRIPSLRSDRVGQD